MRSKSTLSSKILVTGASGFIGRAVVAELSEKGKSVIAMVRRPEQAGLFANYKTVSTIIADVNNLASLTSATQDVDTVIHLAGVVWGGQAGMHRVFVEGTQNLIHAMHQASATQLILVSSISVYDWSKATKTLTESSPIIQGESNEQGAYSQAKAQQEAIARKLCEKYDINLTVIRPGAVFSPEKIDAADIGPRIGFLQFVVAPQRTLRTIHIKFIAEALSLASSVALPNGLTINLVNDDRMTAWDFSRYIRSASKSMCWIIPIPSVLIMLIAKLAYTLAKLVGHEHQLPSLLCPSQVSSRFKSVSFDNACWRKYLPSSSPRPLKDMLIESLPSKNINTSE